MIMYLKNRSVIIITSLGLVLFFMTCMHDIGTRHQQRKKMTLSYSHLPHVSLYEWRNVHW